MNTSLPCAVLVLAASLAQATPLSSVVGGGGGTIDLAPSTVYTGGLNLTAGPTVLNGAAGTVLDLGNDSTYYIVGAGLTLEIRNVTIRNGGGILFGSGSTGVLENVVAENGARLVQASPGATVTVRDSTLAGMNTTAVEVAGGDVSLESVDFTNAAEIRLYNGGQLTWRGGTFTANGGRAINSFGTGGGLSPGLGFDIERVSFDGLGIGEEGAIMAREFGLARVVDCTFTDCSRAIFLADAPATTAEIRRCTIDGSAVPMADRREAINFDNLASGVADGLTITAMRSALVFVDTPTAVVTNSTLYRNARNAVNMTRVGNGLIRDSFLLGDVIRGDINIDDFDVVFAQESKLAIDNCFVIDGADNGILLNESEAVLERSFVAGARTAGLSGRKVDSDPSPAAPGSLMTVIDSTILNSRTHDLNIDATSRAFSRGMILGIKSGYVAFPSQPGFPGVLPTEGTTMQTFSPAFVARHMLLYEPSFYGLQHQNCLFSAIYPDPNAVTVVSFSTMVGRPGTTLEGAYFQNSGDKNTFTDNHFYNITGDRRAILIQDQSGIPTLAWNWLNNPGTFSIGTANATLPTTATDNYYGDPSGPNGLGYTGSGGSVFGPNLAIPGFLTAPPMNSATTLMPVDTDGSGFGSLATDRLRARVFYQGVPASRPDTGTTSAYEALLGLTDYRLNRPLPTLAPPDAGQREVQFNLWLDARLYLYTQRPGDGMNLELTLLGDSQPAAAATLTWLDAFDNPVTATAAEVAQDAEGTRAVFAIPDRASWPRTPLSLRIDPAAASDGVGWMLN